MQKKDFFNNIGGMNITDSPFSVGNNCATGGYNFDYYRTGAFRKSKAHTALNSTPSTELRALGVDLHVTSTNTKTLIRAAQGALKSYDAANAFTAITLDTQAAPAVAPGASSTVPVVFSQFNTSNANLLWTAGGALGSIYGVYSSTKATVNGVTTPTGTLTAVNQGSGTGGAWTPTSGSYFWSVCLRKTSTQALSNASLDQAATISTATDTVLITFPVGIDTTLYDKWYVFRSAVSGVTAFTTGTLVAQVNTSQATYTDTGSAFATSQNVPRSGSVVLDNSTLAAGTYNNVATWNRRLVTCLNSTVYITDLNKPESWLAGLNIVIPTGGNITALGVISFNTPTSTNLDELLVVWKEREIWVIKGTGLYDASTGLYDISLKFIDSIGCCNQSVVINSQGYIMWIDYRGAYLWNGSGKPIYMSRLIEAYWGVDGGLDKSKLNLAWGKFYRKQNQVIWCVSDRTLGEQVSTLKLDVRLTQPNVGSDIEERILDGVFTMGKEPVALYAGMTYLPAGDHEEQFLGCDALGYVKHMYFTEQFDDVSGVDFQYESKFLDMGEGSVSKKYHKVVVWVDKVGPWDLTLDYWSDYRTNMADRTTLVPLAQKPSSASGTAPSLWDLGIWDASFWDDYTAELQPIVFNLSGTNSVGDCLKLRFKQNGANQPITIHGFSVFYSEVGVNK